MQTPRDDSVQAGATQGAQPHREQEVVGDERNAHGHPAVTHTHDHYHVSHQHKSGEMLGSFEHKATYHSHEHNHNAILHAHSGRDPETETHEHAQMAHTHDHEHPTGHP
jgi:hypothetical protein